MKSKKTPAPQRAGTTSAEKRARLVRLMMEIAAIDRDEYRRLRGEMWESVAGAHSHKPADGLREWLSKAS